MKALKENFGKSNPVTRVSIDKRALFSLKLYALAKGEDLQGAKKGQRKLFFSVSY